MDTQLLDRILDAAREAATGSKAMRIEDLQRDLEPLIAVLQTADCDEPLDVAAYVSDFKVLSAHALMDADESGLSDVEPYEITDQALFDAWVEKLWSLAQ